LLAVGLVVAAGPRAGDATKKNLEAMQGDWAAVEFTIDGARATGDEAQCIFRTVKGNEYTLFLFNKPLLKGTFTIDASKRPRTFDAQPLSGPGAGKRVLGIYELEGDRLKICTALPGKERPSDFAAKKGSGHTLTIWEREKK
jgi:uncharacterized protein (TIGR03067 family)